MRLAFRLRWVTSCAIGALLSACSGIPIDADGTRHYLIIGVGIVSVPQSERSVSVSRMHALGVSLSDEPGLKLGIGYASSLVTTVPAELRSAIVEVSGHPLGAIRITTEQEGIVNNKDTVNDTDSMD